MLWPRSRLGSKPAKALGIKTPSVLPYCSDPAAMLYLRERKLAFEFGAGSVTEWHRKTCQNDIADMASPMPGSFHCRRSCKKAPIVSKTELGGRAVPLDIIRTTQNKGLTGARKMDNTGYIT